MKFLFALAAFFPVLAFANVNLSISPGSMYLTGTVNQYGGSGFASVYNFGNEAAKNVYVSSSCFGNFFVNNTCFGDLQPNQSCSITVQFNPTSTGFSSCDVHVYSSNGGFAWLNIQGNADPAPTPRDLD